MRSRLYVLAVLMFSAVAVRAGAQTAHVISLPWSTWSFHLGDDPRCAAVADPGCVWQQNHGRVLPSQAELWQRVVFTLPDSLRSAPQLGLLVQGERPVYEVFLNGRRIGQSGSFETRRGPQNTRAIFAVPADLVRDGHVVLTIHALNLRTMIDPVEFVPAIGPMDQMAAARDLDTLGYLRANWQMLLCYFLSFVVGLVFLVLFSLDRRATENLWLGLNLCAIGCLRFGDSASIFDVGMSSTAAALVYLVGNAPMAAVIIEFSYALVRRPVSLFFRAIEVAGMLFGLQVLLLLPLPGSIFHPLAASTYWIYISYRVALGAAAFARLVPLRMCFRSPLPEMRWIGAGLLFIGVEAESRHLKSLGIPSIPQVGHFGSLAFDFFSFSYVLFAVVMLAAMTARLQRIRQRNQIIEGELAAASAVQHLLLSSYTAQTPAFTIDAVYLPAGEVGGDFFHIVAAPDPEADDSLLVVVGDVSGKGLKAAMTVSTIVGALRGCRERSAAEVLHYMNRVLCGQIDGFVTCCVAHIDTAGTLTLASAGNPAPYCNGRELAMAPGLPLGITPDVEYSETVHRFSLRDRLTFISDGVVEAIHPATRELFGFERTEAISMEAAGSIAETARAFGSPGSQADDITVLTVTRLAAPR